jgi:hypothetical protein
MGAELATRLKEVESRLTDVTGLHIKIVERGGTKLQQLLPNTNPLSGAKCERTDSTMCG